MERGMSGEDLAIAVGYKQQSAIGNLENRAGGAGGKKLPDIARALRVPLTWLAEGPDTGEVPFSEPPSTKLTARHATRAAEPTNSQYLADASLEEAVNLFTKLRTEQRLKAINYMRDLISRAGPGTNQSEVGKVIPFPTTRPRSP